jgi:C-terminal processing protease CtpA/Prc
MKRRATVVGDVTAGRVNRAQMFGGYGGSVYSIPYGVAITVSRFVMEDGQELEGRGVIPDVNCVPSEQDLRDDRDPCLAVALTLARQSVSNPANSTAAANDSQH